MAAKNLIKSFEKGIIVKVAVEGEPEDDGKFKEEIVSPKPGFTKSLVSTYESLSKTKVATTAAAANVAVKQEPKKVLIVFAHWDKRSFNGALLESAKETLEAEGHSVLVSDLYDMGFNPIMSEKDVEDGVQNKDLFRYPEETGSAWERGTLANDIVAELWKFIEADLVIFQSPLCWGSFPAMMKGYLDRVLVNRAVYSHEMMFDTGKFKDKKALVSLTTGGPAAMYGNTGLQGDLESFLWPIMNCTLRFVGFECLPASVFHGVDSSHTPKEALDAMLGQWKERLSSIWSESPVEFLPSDDFNPFLDYTLSQDAVAAWSKDNPDIGPNVGQNLGRPHRSILVHKYPELKLQVAKPEPIEEPETKIATNVETDVVEAKVEANSVGVEEPSKNEATSAVVTTGETKDSEVNKGTEGTETAATDPTTPEPATNNAAAESKPEAPLTGAVETAPVAQIATLEENPTETSEQTDASAKIDEMKEAVKANVQTSQVSEEAPVAHVVNGVNGVKE